MVSLQAPLSPTPRIPIPGPENSSRKRKWEEQRVTELLDKPFEQSQPSNSIFDTELNLETPLPMDWQRCLDVKSGQIHYYNTRTQKRTSKDPRTSPEPPNPGGGHIISLDLELNLPCGSTKADNSGNKNTKNTGGLLRRSPSWLEFDGAAEKEMVTAVCNKCHMLVMMDKSAPECPNCKFRHPQDQTIPQLFRARPLMLGK
ncbi:protein CURLY FLAG LEAF 1 [Diospyros lotus]|uniref:protein CURLY FLAG LEAF 1 n=1 Tax=Diospyros lotus TaxID=55363 RepID=UPI00225191E4|nr:protein CURLY FLAG LEAF 1 [Diospyros lotus]